MRSWSDPRGKKISGYGMPVDKNNNVFMLEFCGTSIGLRQDKDNTRHHLADADRRLAAAARPHRREQQALVRRIRTATLSRCSIPKEAKIKEWVLPQQIRLAL